MLTSAGLFGTACIRNDVTARYARGSTPCVVTISRGLDDSFTLAELRQAAYLFATDDVSVHTEYNTYGCGCCADVEGHLHLVARGATLRET